MDELEDIFDLGTGSNVRWRERVTGEPLELVEAVEARIEQTGERPQWRKLASKLTELGFKITDASVGDYYREKYPHLRTR